jgi:two-component system OmpR family response regulator
VLSKLQILDHAWDYALRGESRIVESYISYLRRKIDVDGLPSLIHTKRGVGYVLRIPPVASTG